MNYTHPRIHHLLSFAVDALCAYLAVVRWLHVVTRVAYILIPCAIAYGYVNSSASFLPFFPMLKAVSSSASQWIAGHTQVAVVCLLAPILLFPSSASWPLIFAGVLAAANLGAGHFEQAFWSFLQSLVVLFLFSTPVFLLHKKFIAPLTVSLAEWLTETRHWAATGSRLEVVSTRVKTEVESQADTSVDSPSSIKYPALKARRRFRDMAGMADLKSKLIEAGRSALTHGLESPNGILLYSKPGNGKTAMSEALAGELGLPFISVSIADIGSKWVNQTTEQLVKVFRDAELQSPCVLLIDEVDSIISERNSGSSNEDSARTTNAFLTEVVRIRGKGVVVVAATNFLDRLDTAAIREGRFDFKIEVPPPDFDARVGLLRSGIKKALPSASIHADELAAVAKRWSGFSVARLLAITEHLAKSHLNKPTAKLDRHDLVKALKEIQAKRSTLPENTKALRDLALENDQAEALDGIAWRMKELFAAEEAGASVPDGVLFYGPPGTGKTEAVRSLARETGWALIVASGSDLAQHPEKIAELHDRAADSRPAIVFIDEADDILRDRQHSGTRMATNKFLTVMDGAHGKTPDVLYIAATNHPDMLDPAVLRGGRFGEKIRFAPPTGDALQAFVEKWLADKGWQVEGGAVTALDLLDGQSIANVQAVLQVALNYRVNRFVRSNLPIVKVIDFEALEVGLATLSPNLPDNTY